MRIFKDLLRYFMFVMKDQHGDIGQMFTPPKSKSPYEAATSGSTGGAFSFAGPSTPTNPDDPAGWGWVGPALTTAAGAIPGFGPFISAGLGASGSMGGGTGFQGTDKGFAGNILPTLMGAAGGYGAGTVGAGIGGGLQQMFTGATGGVSMLNSAMTGPATGVQGFMSGFNQGAGQFGFNPAISNFFRGSGVAGGATATGAGAGTGTGQGAGGAASGIFGGLANQLKSNPLGAAAMLGGGAASLLNKPPETTMRTGTELYQDALSTVVGKYLGEGGLSLPQRAQQEYMDMINTPFGELYEKFTVNDARVGELQTVIGRTYDDYDQQIDASFAQAGGIGSSDHRKALDESRRLRGEELTRGINQVRQSNFEEAIKVKQNALNNAMGQGQFDQKIAIELASVLGREQDLEIALQNQDYEQFQQVMGQVMQMGYESFQPNVSF